MGRLPARLEIEDVTFETPERLIDTRLASVIIGVAVGLAGFAAAMALGLFN